MKTHKIEEGYLKELTDKRNGGKVGVLDLAQLDKDVVHYWGTIYNEVRYPITIKDLVRRAAATETVGVCVQNIDDPIKVMAQWSDSCSSGGDFFILPKEIINYWEKNIKPLTSKSCVVARVAKDEKDKIYLYLHLGDIELIGGGGTGGDDLAKGVRIPAPPAP